MNRLKDMWEEFWWGNNFIYNYWTKHAIGPWDSFRNFLSPTYRRKQICDEHYRKSFRKGDIYAGCTTNGMILTEDEPDSSGMIHGIDLATGEERMEDIWHCGPMELEADIALTILLLGKTWADAKEMVYPQLLDENGKYDLSSENILKIAEELRKRNA